jgi:RNA polymerase sigma-70 factor (ECF subfamily)
MTDEDSRHGDADWFRSVVQQYEGQLVRYAARLLGDVERARDVVQETFLRLCRQPRAAVQDAVRPWLFTVCRRQAIDVRKKEQRMKALSDEHADSITSPLVDPQGAAELAETAGRASALLGRLPENQREVIRLRIQNGLSYREISGVTGLSVSNVGFLIHQGISRIRQQLNAAR